MLDIADIEKEVANGLPHERDRMSEAEKALKFSKARFEEYPTRSKDGRYKSGAPRRTSPVFRRILEVLTANLYKAQPTRKLANPDDGDWLSRTYKASAMGAKWKRADELTLIGGFVAFQWIGTTDPLKPVECRIWDASQCATWTDPDDPTKPIAVCVVDKYDNAKRARLYTRDEVVTFLSSKGIDGPAFGSVTMKELTRRANPYRDEAGLGILPFSFAHWYPPTQEFETDGPGCGLTELNDFVNWDLDALGDSKAFNGRPLGIASNVDPTWSPPVEVKPGDFLTIPPANIDAGGNGPEASLSYLQADLSYVEMDWKDLNGYLDHVLEMHGIPPALIRMVQSSARSGISIMAEQQPLLDWVEGRRPMWSDYEEANAKKAFEVAASHLASNGIGEASALRAVLADWQFTAHWPNLFVLRPGQERDRSDEWRLKNGYASKVMVVMERNDISETEAFEYLAKIKDQNDQLTALGIDPSPPVPFGAMGGPGQPQAPEFGGGESA
jgi:hypothetical protein